MSFITPAFLFAAGAALLPVLYHLIRKLRARKVRFSSLMFLQATPKALIKRRKLRDILLMVIRAVILGLLAFMFARPFMPRETLPVVLTEADTSTVILIDTSYSMGYGDRFEWARAEALDIIGDMNGADETAIITFSDHATQVSGLTSDTVLLRNVIEQAMDTGARTTEYYQPFRLAGEILERARHQRRAIVMISDFQEGGFTSRLGTWQLEEDIGFLPVRIDDERVENMWISLMVTEQRRIGDMETVQFRLQVQAQGAREDDEREVILTIDGREIDRTTVTAASSRQVFFQQDDIPEGDYQGALTLGDDNLGIDNARYFTFAVVKRPSIVCFDGSPASSRSNAFFLASCFEMGDRSLYEYTAATIDRLTPAYLAGHDVVFLTNLPSLSDRQASALRGFCEDGGTVIITFGERFDREQYTAALRALGISAPDAPVGISSRLDTSAKIGDADLRHPVFSVFSASGTGDLSRPRFREYVQVVPDTAAVVVARYGTGDPFLVERKHGAGKMLVMTSSLNTEWGDFPVNDVFLPFVYQLADYGLSTPGVDASYITGDQVAIHGAPGDEWEVRTPGDQIVRVVVDSEGIGWFGDTDMPGNYRAAHGSEQRYFSVNVDTRESDLTARDTAEMHAAVTGRGSVGGNDVSAAALGDAVDEEHRQKLWRFVLMLIIVLILIETVLANRKVRFSFEQNS